MNKTTLPSYWLMIMLLCGNLAYADNKKPPESQKPPPSIDMIELLGEMDDDDPSALETAMNTIDKQSALTKPARNAQTQDNQKQDSQKDVQIGVKK